VKVTGLNPVAVTLRENFKRGSLFFYTMNWPDSYTKVIFAPQSTQNKQRNTTTKKVATLQIATHLISIIYFTF
jgi:hypothetical protein